MRDTQHFILQVIEGIIEVMELDAADDIHGTTRLSQDLGFDSFLYVQLIMFMEDVIGDVHIDPASLTAENLFSVETLAAFCAQLANQRAAS